MGHLNKLHEEYDGKGMTILSVTGEGLDRVEPFVEQFGAKFPVLCKAQSGEYSTGGVPTSYLIGPDGKVLFHGHPNQVKDDVIEKHLKDVKKDHRVSTWAFTLIKQVPPLPDKMSDLMKMMKKRDFGKALKKAEATAAKLEGDDKEAGDAVVAWIKKRAADNMDKAAKLVRNSKIYEAFLVYESVESEFKGHDLAKAAKGELKAMKSDKAMKTEIKASELLIKIKKEIAEERKPEDKLACLKPLLSKKYEDTLAGKKAAEMAEAFESQVK